MARPIKAGLDYFLSDVDFWDEGKIMDLTNEYGPIGVCVYDVILRQVYRNGYYLEISPDTLAARVIRIIGNRWIENKSRVLEVIDYCAEIGLFDKALLSQSIITSVGIQQRYAQVSARNKVDKSKYWLLEESAPSTASTDPETVTVTETEVSATETGISATETPVSVGHIPQRREEKRREEKRRRECVRASGGLRYRLALSGRTICGDTGLLRPTDTHLPGHGGGKVFGKAVEVSGFAPVQTRSGQFCRELCGTMGIGG